MRALTVGLVVGLCLGGIAAADGQTPSAAPASPAVSDTAHGQATATVNAPVQLLGVPVRVAAPDPVPYLGSAYQDDISGQSESNSDPAIAENVRNAGPGRPDAW